MDLNFIHKRHLLTLFVLGVSVGSGAWADDVAVASKDDLKAFGDLLGGVDGIEAPSKPDLDKEIRKRADDKSREGNALRQQTQEDRRVLTDRREDVYERNLPSGLSIRAQRAPETPTQAGGGRGPSNPPQTPRGGGSPGGGGGLQPQ